MFFCCKLTEAQVIHEGVWWKLGGADVVAEETSPSHIPMHVLPMCCSGLCELDDWRCALVHWLHRNKALRERRHSAKQPPHGHIL